MENNIKIKIANKIYTLISIDDVIKENDYYNIFIATEEVDNAHVELSVKKQHLIEFIEEFELNNYCFDRINHEGEHVQTNLNQDIEIFLEENVLDVCEDYVRSLEYTEFSKLEIEIKRILKSE